MRIYIVLLALLSCLQLHSQDTVKIINQTFLGNWERNYYGNVAPASLNVIWKHSLGTGKTVISRKIGERYWSGAGWTGQPLMIEEHGKQYLFQGAYDHHLKKIDAQTGKLIWQYAFDDVIKGTGTIWRYKSAPKQEFEYVIFQGSRLGVGNYLDSKHIPSFRAISLLTGKELWRLDVRWDKSYSRDVDASALILSDTLYIGLENGLFTVIDPKPENAKMLNGMKQPPIIQELPLYAQTDFAIHKGNVVTEASPCLLGNRIYSASGSGHIYGYNLDTRTIDWDYFIGSDIDGSPVVTSDSCIIVSIEKQYIKGRGGVLKLDPSKNPENATVWFMPTENKKYATWDGGMIGTVSINDSYKNKGEKSIAAFTAIDGYLYVVEHNVTNGQDTAFDGKTVMPIPNVIYKKYVGPAIASTLIVGNSIVAATYNGLYLLKFDANYNFTQAGFFEAEFESTPFIHDGRIYVASRNGYLYCFGD